MHYNIKNYYKKTAICTIVVLAAVVSREIIITIIVNNKILWSSQPAITVITENLKVGV